MSQAAPTCLRKSHPPAFRPSPLNRSITPSGAKTFVAGETVDGRAPPVDAAARSEVSNALVCIHRLGQGRIAVVQPLAASHRHDSWPRNPDGSDR